MAEKELVDFLKDLNKSMGGEKANRVKEIGVVKIERNPIGVVSLDNAIGGGFPKGRIIELYGRESSGKTTLALLSIAESQRNGGVCAFVDVEQALDFEYASFLGVDVDELVVSQPDNGEEALEITDRLVGSGLFSIVVFDSVAAIVPKAELEGEMGDQKMGVVARLMAQAMRKLTGKTNKTGTSLVFINQVRDKLGIVFGNPEVTTGGKSLAFAASIRIEVSKGSQLKEGEIIIGHLIKIKVVKNKVSPPFKKAEVENIFGLGIDKIKDLLQVASSLNIIQKSGSWYAYGDTKLGQGLDKVKIVMADNPELYEEVKEKTLNFKN